MADLTLQQLLDSLQPGIDKQAGEDGKEEKKENPFAKKEDGEKDEKKDDDKGGNPFAKKEDKDDKKDEKYDDKGQEKKASDAGADLARQIMEKVAKSNIESVTGMNKTSAAVAGKTLADALLEKLASAGDLTTTDGVAPGSPANKNQADSAQIVAEDDAKIKPMQTSDGNKPTGSINEIFDAVVADAVAQGAASVDQVHDTGVAKDEGKAEDKAMPNQVQEKMAALNELMSEGVSFEDAVGIIKQAELEQADNLEKVAAVQTLVESGVDFDTASDLVKQAAADLAREEEDMTKAAAVSELLAQGIDFDKAVEMVKEASAGDLTTTDGVAPGSPANKNQADSAQIVAEDDAKIKPMQTSDGNQPTGSINEIFDAIIADAMAQGAASVDQVHTTGVVKAEGAAEKAVPNQVKSAALAKLIEAGVDFEKAAGIVKEAAEKQAGLAGIAKNIPAMAKSYAGKAVAAAKANPKVVAGVAAGYAGGRVVGAIDKSMSEKKAEAITLLIEQGVDFDQASDMVKAASDKLGV